jgi:hypothetical protein
MLKRLRMHFSLAGLIVWLLSPILGVATPVELNTWTAESYPAVAGFDAGVWTVSPGGDAVTQSVDELPVSRSLSKECSNWTLQGVCQWAPGFL